MKQFSYLCTWMELNDSNWTALYITPHNICSVPHRSSLLIWHILHKITFLIRSYCVYLHPHISSFLIWFMWHRWRNKNHRQFNSSYIFSILPEVIIDHLFHHVVNFLPQMMSYFLLSSIISAICSTMIFF